VLVSILYLLAIIFGIISSCIYLAMLRKSAAGLTEGWRKSAPFKNFSQSLSFFIIFLFFALLNELITSYFARHRIPNAYVFSTYFSIATFLLFSFLFVHTQTRWKRYGYVVLYAILVGHLIQGGYFHPLSSHPTATYIILNTVFFLAGLLHLTDLLINPKADYFHFKLKICLVFLIFPLMGNILTSFHWSDITSDHIINYPFIFLLQIGNMILFYFSFGCVFTSEIIKLRRG
jgi:hypothetical protein